MARINLFCFHHCLLIILFCINARLLRADQLEVNIKRQIQNQGFHRFTDLFYLKKN